MVMILQLWFLKIDCAAPKLYPYLVKCKPSYLGLPLFISDNANCVFESVERSYSFQFSIHKSSTRKYKENVRAFPQFEAVSIFFFIYNFTYMYFFKN